MSKKRSRKKKIIAPKAQTIFCLISLFFIITCCCYYGNRLIKYYKIYNPKSETGEKLENLSSSIISNSSIVFEGDGLYSSNGNYVYKGTEVNNYLLLSNMLFRIISINGDKTITIVLDDYINKLKWDSETKDYNDSYINKYLNEKFLNAFDKDLLVESSVCTDVVTELSEVTCNNTSNDNFVRLLGVSEFLNSINDSKSYLIHDNEYLWLYNRGEKNVWHTLGNKIYNNVPSKMYGIKPVLTLKNSTILVKGDGSINSPYQVTNDDTIGVGSYLDINDKIYIVYETGEDYYKLESAKLLPKRMSFDDKANEYSNSKIKDYLNNTYLESLNFNNILVETDFNGDKSSVGMLSLEDLKFGSNLKGYFLTDKLDSNVYLYNDTIISSKSFDYRYIRPCIAVKKDLSIISGNGSKMAPFIVEVK